MKCRNAYDCALGAETNAVVACVTVFIALLSATDPDYPIQQRCAACLSWKMACLKKHYH